MSRGCVIIEGARAITVGGGRAAVVANSSKPWYANKEKRSGI
jgi:hypothetical protein